MLALAGNKTNPFGFFDGVFNNEYGILLITCCELGKMEELTTFISTKCCMMEPTKKEQRWQESTKAVWPCAFMGYEGVIAFVRCSLDAKAWLAFGKEAVSAFHVWVKRSEWNVESKLLLIEAEFHFLRGEHEYVYQVGSKASLCARRRAVNGFTTRIETLMTHQGILPLLVIVRRNHSLSIKESSY